MTPITRGIVWLATAATGALLAVAQTTPTTSPVVPMKLFLLVGQSNMAGRGVVEAQDRVADPRVGSLDARGAWVPAVDPLHSDKPTAGVGLGRTFAIAVADATRDGLSIGLVPCAVGGTSIDQWSPDGKLYGDAIARARVAARSGRFVGILWHQGESDVADDKRDAYPAKLGATLAAFRRDLGDETLPIVIGELGRFAATKRPGVVPMNALLNDFARTHANVACASSERLTSMGDDLHFDAASQRELGRRYARAFLGMIATTRRTTP